MKIFLSVLPVLSIVFSASFPYWKKDRWGNLEETDYQKYIGRKVKPEDDYDTDTEPTFPLTPKDLQLKPYYEGEFPLFRNIVASCAIDSVLQVLLTIRFDPIVG